MIAVLSEVREMDESHADAGGKSKQIIKWKSAATIVTLACGIICLEWVTMLCTQLKSAEDGKHWKAQNGSKEGATCASKREEPPKLVSTIFRNNFRSPLGVLSIYGLFSCGLWTYGSYIVQIKEAIPYFQWWWALAVLGRLLSIRVELWLCLRYLRLILAEDEVKRT